LGAGLACEVGTAEAASIETDSIAIALLGASLDGAYPDEGLGARNVASIAGDRDVLPWKQAQGIGVAHLDGESPSRDRAHSLIASEVVFGVLSAIDHQVGAKAS
jgi:hypothetical protein